MTSPFKTFNEWSRAGYKIKKGSKATWIGDVAMFSKDQVMLTQRSYSYHWQGCTPKGTSPEWGGSCDKYSEGYGDEWDLH